MVDLSAKLDAVLKAFPLAVSLFDTSGRILGKSGRLANLFGDVIPSHSRVDAGLWLFTDSSGAAIAPIHWPGPRALRGETNPNGMPCRYLGEGQADGRVIAMPFSPPDTGIAAISFLQFVDRERRARDGLYDDLEERLLAMLIDAVSRKLS